MSGSFSKTNIVFTIESYLKLQENRSGCVDFETGAGKPYIFPFSDHSYYAKLRQQEIERERELAEKYRDRAKERRDGVNKDYEETELISTTANYRAVGPTAEA